MRLIQFQVPPKINTCKQRLRSFFSFLNTTAQLCVDRTGLRADAGPDRAARTGTVSFNLPRVTYVLLPFLFSMLMIQSCQEKVDWELEYENTLRLVVEAKITNERRAHEVKLSLPVYEINGTPRPVSGAEVYLSDGDTIITLREDPARSGIYLTAENVQGVVNKTYMLLVRVNDFECTAIARMEAVTPVRFPTYYQVRQNPPLYELRFTGSDAPSMMKLEMDWSHLPGYDTLPDDRNHAVVYGYFFDALTVDVNELFSPAQDRVFFPPGTHVVITKESLSDGYAEFLRGMLSETVWNGGLFDVKPGDPFTNLSRGAIGYFAATSVLRDTIVFNP